MSHKRATHFNDERYSCETCNRSFKRRRLLEYHIKSTHTGERPFKCTEVGIWFCFAIEDKVKIRYCSIFSATLPSFIPNISRSIFESTRVLNRSLVKCAGRNSIAVIIEMPIDMSTAIKSHTSARYAIRVLCDGRYFMHIWNRKNI